MKKKLNPEFEAVIERVRAAADRIREGGVSAEQALEAACELWIATNPPVVAEDDDGEEWKNN